MGTDKESEEMKQLREVVFNDNLKIKSMTFTFSDEEITIKDPFIIKHLKEIMRLKMEYEKINNNKL